MNIIKKHYAIKQCQKLDKLISIQEDICKTLEIGYNLVDYSDMESENFVRHEICPRAFR